MISEDELSDEIIIVNALELYVQLQDDGPLPELNISLRAINKLKSEDVEANWELVDIDSKEECDFSVEFSSVKVAQEKKGGRCFLRRLSVDGLHPCVNVIGIYNHLYDSIVTMLGITSENPLIEIASDVLNDRKKKRLFNLLKAMVESIDILASLCESSSNKILQACSVLLSVSVYFEGVRKLLPLELLGGISSSLAGLIHARVLTCLYEYMGNDIEKSLECFEVFQGYIKQQLSTTQSNVLQKKKHQYHLFIFIGIEKKLNQLLDCIRTGHFKQFIQNDFSQDILMKDLQHNSGKAVIAVIHSYAAQLQNLSVVFDEEYKNVELAPRQLYELQSALFECIQGTPAIMAEQDSSVGIRDRCQQGTTAIKQHLRDYMAQKNSLPVTLFTYPDEEEGLSGGGRAIGRQTMTHG